MNIKFFKISSAKDFICISFLDSANQRCFINIKIGSLLDKYLKSIWKQYE